MTKKTEPPKIVHLHEGRPSLADVVGRLRLLADDIEAGKLGKITTAFVVLPTERDYPIIYGFGDVETDNHPVLQFELAKQKFIFNMMKRT